MVALTRAFNGATREGARSVAERKRIEERMRDFVADAGHELRTPLTIAVASSTSYTRRLP
jgi:signal transduction histidine kinase